MIYGDLDHLKEINDNWGHSEGDYAIQCAGQILKKCLRDTDIIGRIGGDEFVALIFSESDSFQTTFHHRVTEACKMLNATSGKPYYVELSVGVAAFDFTPETNLKNIVSQADSLLYEQKKYRRKSIRREA
jgi:diguanylate cyclase (GGDEF)-like protein